MVDAHNAMIAEEAAIKQQYECSDECAAKVAYLRQRSRWSEAKERELVELDANGQALPDVYVGEEVS